MVETFIKVEINRPTEGLPKTYSDSVEIETTTLQAFRQLNPTLYIDLYFKNGSGLILPSSESKIFIKDILSSNKITLGPNKDDVPLPTVAEAAATLATRTNSMKPADTNTFEPIAQLKQANQFIDEKSSTSNTLLSPVVFKETDLQSLSKLKLRQTVDSIFGSNTGAIQWELKDAIILKPEETFTSDCLFTYNESQSLAYKCGVYQGSGKVARALKVSSDIKTSVTRESFDEKKKSTVYLHSFYIVPRLELKISEELIKLDPNFKNQLYKIVAEKNVVKLNALLEATGRNIPTRFVLGGKITFDDKKEINSSNQRERSVKEFATQVNASIKLLSTATSVGISQEKEKKETRVGESTSTTKTILGGDPTKIANLNDWISTLSSLESWTIIQRDRFVSIWEVIKNDQDKSLFNELSILVSNSLRSVDILSSYEKEKSHIIVNGFKYNIGSKFEQLAIGAEVDEIDSLLNNLPEPTIPTIPIISTTPTTSAPSSPTMSTTSEASSSSVPLTSLPSSPMPSPTPVPPLTHKRLEQLSKLSPPQLQNEKLTADQIEQLKKSLHTKKVKVAIASRALAYVEKAIHLFIIDPNDTSLINEADYNIYGKENSLDFCEKISSNMNIENDGKYLIMLSHGDIFSSLSKDAQNLLKSFNPDISNHKSFVIICKIKKGIPHLKLTKATKKSSTYLNLNLN